MFALVRVIRRHRLALVSMRRKSSRRRREMRVHFPGVIFGVQADRNDREPTMHRRIIEQEISQSGHAEAAALHDAAERSDAVHCELGSRVQWIEFDIAAERAAAVHLAEIEKIIRHHADISGFPATRILEIGRMIDPPTPSD